MQRQIPILSQPLSLNPLKDMAKLDEVDCSAGFGNLYSKMHDFEKVSYNMLRYISGLAKVGYQYQLHSTETKKMTLTKIKKLLNSIFN